MVVGLLLWAQSIQPSAPLNQPSPAALSSLAVAVGSQSPAAVFQVSLRACGATETAIAPVRQFPDATPPDWELPLEAAIAALGWSLEPLDNGSLQVRSPHRTVRLSPRAIDPALGRTISGQELQAKLGVQLNFDRDRLELELIPPAPPADVGNSENLPRIRAPQLTVAAIGQRTDIAGRSNENTTGIPSLSSRGELTAVGTAFGGSWYARVNQPDLEDRLTWTLADAQYWRETPNADYAIGSQPTFWQGSEGGEYWGVTVVRRWGVAPPSDSKKAGFDPQERLQGRTIRRTIAGEAEPGTLVQLVEGVDRNVVAEGTVGQSGVYRFENVPIRRDLANQYRVLLYPEGRLSAQPEIETADVRLLPAQLPNGASAAIVSLGGSPAVGSDREFLVQLDRLRAGVAYRYGVSDELTLGLGAAYDRVEKGIAELFFAPDDLPISIALLALTQADREGIDVNADVRVGLLDNINLRLESDRLSQRFQVDWELLEGLTLIAKGNNLNNAIATGMRWQQVRPGLFTQVRVDVDGENNWRWRLASRLGGLHLLHEGKLIGEKLQVSYNFADSLAPRALGHTLFFQEETRQHVQRDNDRLLKLGWRYRSRGKSENGLPDWEVELARGFGSQGEGWLMTAETRILQGILLRARYEEISLVSDENRFRIEAVSSFQLQGGVREASPNIQRLRDRGGIWLQPFLDRNANGKRDRGEPLHLQRPRQLFEIDGRVAIAYQPQKRDDGIFILLPPGVYRLDLLSEAYPADYFLPEPAYAVEVVAGSYTPALIPLQPRS